MTVCAWCGKVIIPGGDDRVSHGICEDCAPAWRADAMATIEAEKIRRAVNDNVQAD